MSAPVKVGLIGAGPWAKLFHAPMIAGCPETELVGVWARRPEAAEEIAASHKARSFLRFDEMLEHVDALSFAVPPDVQAKMAGKGALAGKALLLEKPIALDLGRAEELVDIVNETGAPTQMVLTWRYADSVRAFLDTCHGIEPLGGRGHFLTGGLLGGIFETPWRVEMGPLFDLGPHVLDLLDAALGPIREVSARGDAHRWVDMQLVHESGSHQTGAHESGAHQSGAHESGAHQSGAHHRGSIVSNASITAYSAVDPPRAGVEVYSVGGVHEVDTVGLSGHAIERVALEFADTTRSRRPHQLDANHGLRLQRLIATAAKGLS